MPKKSKKTKQEKIAEELVQARKESRAAYGLPEKQPENPELVKIRYKKMFFWFMVFIFFLFILFLINKYG